MKFIKPNFYDAFHCTAAACSDTCCAGWEIDVDPDTVEYYENLEGELGDRLREAVEAAVVDWQGESLSITISIGMAVLREGDDPEKLLARADKALYRAKREGRNRVCAAPAYVD